MPRVGAARSASLIGPAGEGFHTIRGGSERNRGAPTPTDDIRQFGRRLLVRGIGGLPATVNTKKV